MPHFLIETDDLGRVRRILKDDLPHDGPVRLERAYDIVTTYFRLAEVNLRAMELAAEGQARRDAGIQSFLMSLTGLEAFTNTYFHIRAQEIDSGTMLERIAQSHGSLTRRITDLLALTPDPPLHDQAELMERVFALSQLRNEIMHPRWEPSALTVPGEVPVLIAGLIENRQALFEDVTLCREAMLWCLLVVARVGQSRGHTDVGGFLFLWTSNYGLTVDLILQHLGLPGGAACAPGAS